MELVEATVRETEVGRGAASGAAVAGVAKGL
jgi:hypothetical protein